METPFLLGLLLLLPLLILLKRAEFSGEGHAISRASTRCKQGIDAHYRDPLS